MKDEIVRAGATAAPYSLHALIRPGELAGFLTNVTEATDWDGEGRALWPHASLATDAFKRSTRGAHACSSERYSSQLSGYPATAVSAGYWTQSELSESDDARFLSFLSFLDFFFLDFCAHPYTTIHHTPPSVTSSRRQKGPRETSHQGL